MLERKRLCIPIQYSIRSCGEANKAFLKLSKTINNVTINKCNTINIEGFDTFGLYKVLELGFNYLLQEDVL